MTDMTNGEKMAALMRRLKVEMNGAVVDAMRERGIAYPLSYGVSVPAIREAAAGYAPDHKLAILLYQQQVRELRLAALMIADPAEVNVEDLVFWAEGVINTEVAEHLAVALMSKTAVTGELMRLWLAADDDLLKYAALLSAAGRLAIDKDYEWLDWKQVSDSLPFVLRSENRYVWQGAVRFLERVARISQKCRENVQDIITEAGACGYPSAQYLADELGWQLDM